MFQNPTSNRYFWKTMRSDVVQWIKNCPQCSSRKRKPTEVGTESHLEALSLQQTQDDVDRCVGLCFRWLKMVITTVQISEKNTKIVKSVCEINIEQIRRIRITNKYTYI